MRRPAAVVPATRIRANRIGCTSDPGAGTAGPPTVATSPATTPTLPPAGPAVVPASSQGATAKTAASATGIAAHPARRPSPNRIVRCSVSVRAAMCCGSVARRGAYRPALVSPGNRGFSGDWPGPGPCGLARAYPTRKPGPDPKGQAPVGGLLRWQLPEHEVDVDARAAPPHARAVVHEQAERSRREHERGHVPAVAAVARKRQRRV